MNYLPPRDVQAVIDLVAACLRHRVRFHGTPGVFMIELEGLQRVLSDLASDYVVLGFDTFTLEGVSVQPRLDYCADFGDGLAVVEALSEIAAWPHDEGLWVEAVLAQR